MVTSTRYSTYRDDKLARLIGVCVDSTSRVAEVLLHESERKFHAFFNGSFQFIGLLIKEGIVLEVKQKVLNFRRLQPQDVVGRSYPEIWWTLIVSQQYLRYLVFSTAAIIYTYESSGYFFSVFLSENFVAISGYPQTLEYPSFWTSAARRK
jgi:PAS domain-containing protein